MARFPPRAARCGCASTGPAAAAGGNVRAGALCVLRTPIPYVRSVANRRPAGGGRDGETVDEAKVRAGRALRTCDRAVTAADYEVIAGDAAGAAVRVHCVAAGGSHRPGPGAGGARRVRLRPRAAAVRRADPGRQTCSSGSRRRWTSAASSAPRSSWSRRATAASRSRCGCAPGAAGTASGWPRTPWPRCTGGCTRATAARTDPGGRSDGRSRSATCTRRWPGWPDLDYVEDARLYPADPATGSARRGRAARRGGRGRAPVLLRPPDAGAAMRGPVGAGRVWPRRRGSARPTGSAGRCPRCSTRIPLFLGLCAAFDELLARSSRRLTASPRTWTLAGA